MPPAAVHANSTNVRNLSALAAATALAWRRLNPAVAPVLAPAPIL